MFFAFKRKQKKSLLFVSDEAREWGERERKKAREGERERGREREREREAIDNQRQTEMVKVRTVLFKLDKTKLSFQTTRSYFTLKMMKILFFTRGLT